MSEKEIMEAWYEILDAGETIEDEVYDTWRWGNCNRRVYRLDGKTWAIEYRTQPEEGVQEFGLPEPYEVEAREVTTTEWVHKCE